MKQKAQVQTLEHEYKLYSGDSGINHVVIPEHELKRLQVQRGPMFQGGDRPLQGFWRDSISRASTKHKKAINYMYGVYLALPVKKQPILAGWYKHRSIL